MTKFLYKILDYANIEHHDYENVEKNQKPLQFDNASQSIDFKNIDFNSEDLETNNNHEIKREELLDIDVSFEQINKKTDNTIDSTIDEEILLKNLDDIEVVEPIQVLKDQEKIYSHDENGFKHYLKVDINEIEVIDPMHIIPYVSLGNNSYSKNAEDNLDKEKATSITDEQGLIYTGTPKILKEICPGVFGTIRPIGYCMIGKRWKRF